MSSHIRTTAIFLVSCLAQGQTPPLATSVQPSNGVLELSAAPILGPDRRPASQRHDVYGLWAGLVEVKIRNVSGGVVRLEETAIMSEFAVYVLDSAGAAVTRTERGRRVEGAEAAKRSVVLSSTLVQLVPLQETTREVDLSNFFEIRPGQAYKVTIRRSQGIPKIDAAGKPLKDAELSCSFDVPDYGILR